MSRYLVFDWGGTFMKYALMNEEADILEKGKVKSPGKKDTVESFFAVIDGIVEKYPGIDGIAISSPESSIAHRESLMWWEFSLTCRNFR